MTLITTPGGSIANSLCSLEEASTFLAGSGLDLTAWEDSSEAEQENLLILSGLALNNLAWRGWPCYEKQAMCWPRWLPGEAEYSADTATFPENVKRAQALLGYTVIRPGIQPPENPMAAPATHAIKSLSLFGDVSISFGEALEVPLRDGLSLAMLSRTGHTQLYLLLSAWAVEVHIFGDSDDEPTLLDEVA